MRLTILLMCLLPGFLALHAQKSLPEKVQTGFAAHFPQAQIEQWQALPNDTYLLAFSLEDHACTARYYQDGSLEESRMQLEEEEVPAAVWVYIEESLEENAYPAGFSLVKQGGSSRILLEVETENSLQSHWFDEAGNFLEVEKRQRPAYGTDGNN